MRQFQFTSAESSVQATVVVDMIDPNTQLFTIMDIRGGKENVFENRFPWKLGDKVYMSELMKWYSENQSIFTEAYMYGGLQVVQLGTDNVKKITLTATITTEGSETDVDVDIIEIAPNGTKRIISTTLTHSVAKEISPIYVGYKYSFELKSEGVAWTSGSAPTEITCDGNESVAIKVTYSQEE